MLKQLLYKLPRKPSKSETADPGSSNSSSSTSSSNLPNLGNIIQRANISLATGTRSNIIKLMSSAVFPASNQAVFETLDPYISFNAASNSEKQNLFFSKLNLCCDVFDFNDSEKNTADKDIRQHTLTEILEFITSGSARFTEPVISATCKMISANLFRVFSPRNRQNRSMCEVEGDEPALDPSWPHLHVLYDILLHFVCYSSLEVKSAKKYIDQSFILGLMDLFASEDSRERDCLKTILHRIYGKFMTHRPFIRKAIGNIIYRFVFEIESQSGIAELLEVFGSVISGFALPLKEEHRVFLWRTLMPLHKPKSVGFYHHQLTYCISQFIKKEPELGSTVITGLLKYWPMTNTQKELMFLSEVEEILEITNISEFGKIMVPLFIRLKYCLNSSHFQVAERALLVCNNEMVVSLIREKREVALPLLLPALHWNTQHHWNRAVLNLSISTKHTLGSIDQDLLLSSCVRLEEDAFRLTAAAHKRRLAWEELESAARTNLPTPAACTVSC